jgi:uncharacterized protein (DUF2062 family)
MIVNFSQMRKGSSRLRSKRKVSRWSKFFRYWYIRLVRLQGHPKEISRGLAVGVFAGWFPLIGLQMAVAILLAIFFRGNKFAAAAATWVSNPLTSVPIYAFNYSVGEFFLGGGDSSVKNSDFKPSTQLFSHFLDLGSDFLVKLFLGCFVIGLILAFATYFISLNFIIRWRNNREIRRPRI